MITDYLLKKFVLFYLHVGKEYLIKLFWVKTLMFFDLYTYFVIVNIQQLFA